MAEGVGINGQIPTFLVGIDPAAEHQPVGLNHALTRGRGLISGEPVEQYDMKMAGPGGKSFTVSIIPVLVNEHGLRDLTYSFTIEELGRDLRPTRVVVGRTWEGPELANTIRLGMGHLYIYKVLGQSGPLRYPPATSPYPEHWPHAFGPSTLV